MYSNYRTPRVDYSQKRAIKGTLPTLTHPPPPPLTAPPSSLAPTEENDVIGFASLPTQLHRKVVKKGFDFTLMVVGETGLGKSTLINSLFLQDLYEDRIVPGAIESVSKTTEVSARSTEIEEKGVKLRLTIVDTPGFGDRPDGSQCWRPIVKHLERQFRSFHQAESSVHRKKIDDTRVHCCLYFVSPYGRGLRQLDIAAMKALQELVTLVPVIGKSDTLTPREVQSLKRQIREDLQKHSITTYDFFQEDSDDEMEQERNSSRVQKEDLPFAIVGSNTVIEAGGRRMRGRMYPWGIVEVDNPSHCDFSKLRQMLIGSHMQDLKDSMRDVHYENFRAKIIGENANTMGVSGQYVTEDVLRQKDDELRRMQAMLNKLQTEMKHQQSPTAKRIPAQAQLSGLGNL